MRSLLVLLEDLVGAEFGDHDLSKVRTVAAERMHDAGRLEGPTGRVMAFVQAVAQVRHRPVLEAYTFVGLKLVSLVAKEYPALLGEVNSTSALLMQVSRMVPTIGHALLPGVDVPHVDLELLDAGTHRLSFHGPAELAATIEGVVIGLGGHFGERVTVERGTPPAYAPNRRVIDVKVTGDPDRRKPPASGAPAGAERRRFFGL